MFKILLVPVLGTPPGRFRASFRLSPGGRVYRASVCFLAATRLALNSLAAALAINHNYRLIRLSAELSRVLLGTRHGQRGLCRLTKADLSRLVIRCLKRLKG